jgi:hypothetical protein
MRRSLVIAGLAVALVASGCGSSVQHAGTTPAADTLGPLHSTRRPTAPEPNRGVVLAL